MNISGKININAYFQVIIISAASFQAKINLICKFYVENNATILILLDAPNRKITLLV